MKLELDVPEHMQAAVKHAMRSGIQPHWTLQCGLDYTDLYISWTKTKKKTGTGAMKRRGGEKSRSPNRVRRAVGVTNNDQSTVALTRPGGAKKKSPSTRLRDRRRMMAFIQRRRTANLAPVSTDMEINATSPSLSNPLVLDPSSAERPDSPCAAVFDTSAETSSLSLSPTSSRETQSPELSVFSQTTEEDVSDRSGRTVTPTTTKLNIHESFYYKYVDETETHWHLHHIRLWYCLSTLIATSEESEFESELIYDTKRVFGRDPGKFRQPNSGYVELNDSNMTPADIEALLELRKFALSKNPCVAEKYPELVKE